MEEGMLKEEVQVAEAAIAPQNAPVSAEPAAPAAENAAIGEKPWNGFAESVIGGGHIARGIPCQDASQVLLAPMPAVIVCDGRGSAKLSHFGAQGAVKAFRRQLQIMEPMVRKILDDPQCHEERWVTVCKIMYRTLLQEKAELAAEHSLPEKEFDFTVAFAVVGQHHVGCFQVGDGAIVIRQNGVSTTVFQPDKGEFANQTIFLRPGGEARMRFHYKLWPVAEEMGIAVTSDGPEHKMFRLPDMIPGEIFARIMDDLRAGLLKRQDIVEYLSNKIWDGDPRGADDRSLALLVNNATIIEEEEEKEPTETPTEQPPEAEVAAPPAAAEEAPEDNAADSTPDAVAVSPQSNVVSPPLEEKPAPPPAEQPVKQPTTPTPNVHRSPRRAPYAPSRTWGIDVLLIGVFVIGVVLCFGLCYKRFSSDSKVDKIAPAQEQLQQEVQPEPKQPPMPPVVVKESPALPTEAQEAQAPPADEPPASAAPTETESTAEPKEIAP